MIKNDIIPNLFLVGAEKAGTTFLVRYLKKIDEIYVPVIKEPQFFSKDIYPEYKDEMYLYNIPQNKWHKNLHMAYIRDENLYFSLYRSSNNKHLYLLDSSVSYLFSKVAAKEIYRFNPKSKIIIILRNPIERAFSAYKMDVTIGRVKEPFEVAIKIIPRYIERGLYYEQVRRYLDTFPKKNVLILFFDDLKKNPQYIFDRIFQFLNLEPTKFKEFNKVNESYQPKFIYINNFLYKTGLKYFISYYLPNSIKEKIKKIYYQEKFDYKLDKSLYNNLLEIFREDINKLSVLLDKDLSFWLKKR